MIAKKHMLLLAIIPIFLLSLIATTIPVQAALPAPSVKIYTSLPVYPFVAPGGRFNIDIIIETNGLPDDSAQGIIGWGLLLRVDPAVLRVGRVLSSNYGYFLYEFADWYWYPYPSLVSSLNATKGEASASEQFLGTIYGGAGDPWSGLKLLTLQVQSLSDTKCCLIDIVKGDYQTYDGKWHPFDIMVDGQYGEPIGEPCITYLSNQDAALNLQDPIGSTWHELWPNYCNTMTLTSWDDNGDGVLSASDQIDMVNNTDGWTYWWHVDAVTVTIHWTFKPDGVTQDPELTGEAEPASSPDEMEAPIGDPIGTGWHQIYPDYCRPFRITSWDDNGDQVFSASDQFDFVYEDDPTTYWAHLDEVTIDLVVSFKEKGPQEPEFPLGLGLMLAIAPAIPIAYLWRLRRKVTKR
jgi:hypothetical protein